MKTTIVLCALFATALAINIKCDFKMRFVFHPFLHQYTCIVREMTSVESISVEEVTGRHLQGKSNADVRQISFGYYLSNFNDLSFIPQNITNHFSNIIGMEFWNNCKIKSLSGDELLNYHDLEFFAIFHNPIDKIPGNLFRNNQKLKLIAFDNNKITKVGSNLFDGLNNLIGVIFKRNSCIDESFGSKMSLTELIEKLKQDCPYPEDLDYTVTKNLE
jgi:hypothetical protein